MEKFVSYAVKAFLGGCLLVFLWWCFLGFIHPLF